MATVAAILGGQRELGQKVEGPLDFDALIRKGIPLGVVSYIKKEFDLTDDMLAAIMGASLRTIARRKKVSEAGRRGGAGNAFLRWRATGSTGLPVSSPWQRKSSRTDRKPSSGSETRSMVSAGQSPLPWSRPTQERERWKSFSPVSSTGSSPDAGMAPGKTKTPQSCSFR